MKPELENVSAETLQQVLEWARGAVDFAQDQAPLLAQEILTWGAVEGWFAATVGCLTLSMSILFLLLGVRWWLTKDECSPAFIISFVASLMGGIPAIWGIGTLIKIHHCPRLYLIEELSRMLG